MKPTFCQRLTIAKCVLLHFGHKWATFGFKGMEWDVCERCGKSRITHLHARTQ